MNVHEAETQLRQAKAEEAAKAQNALKKELAETRAALRTARSDYMSLAKRIRAGEASVARLQAMVDEITGELTLSMSERPEVADALPEDEDVVAWKSQHDRLLARRQELIDKRNRVTASMPPRLEAAKYEGQFGKISALERSCTNLLRRINGEPIGSSLQGGAFLVG
jgi:uncharacterized protein YhaN